MHSYSQARHENPYPSRSREKAPLKRNTALRLQRLGSECASDTCPIIPLIFGREEVLQRRSDGNSTERAVLQITSSKLLPVVTAFYRKGSKIILIAREVYFLLCDCGSAIGR